MAELLIKGGMVIDGTGNAGYEADVFVKDGKIVKIAKIAKNEKTETSPNFTILPVRTEVPPKKIVPTGEADTIYESN